jgi:cell division protein FtsL
MTAPARSGGRAARAKTPTKSTKSAEQADRAVVTHNRSAAAERAYARRAGRAPGNRPKDARDRTERKSGSASRVSFVVLVMGLLVVGVVATLWLSTQSTADSVQLAQVNKNTQILAAKVQQLQQLIAQGESPDQIAAAAQRLGMVPAGNLAHIVVGPNGQITVVGTPSAATAPPPPPPPDTSTDDPSTTTANPPDGSTQTTAGG